MKETLIEFETAKLAKEKGFEDCEIYWANYYKGCPLDKWKLEDAHIPTQSLLQKWLREEHNIHIDAGCNASGWYLEICKTNGTTIMGWDMGVDTDSGHFATYELALEKGLIEALKLIKL